MKIYPRMFLFAWAVALLPALAIVAAEPRELRVPMRDGVELATRVHLPDGEGPWPVILIRSTYSHVFLSPLWGNVGAKRGYAVVLQHTRGRFESQGKDIPFETDGWADGLGDGYDTVRWLRVQPWCNGKIGTLGGSALGITQYQLAGSGAAVDGQQIQEATPSMYHGMYWGGVFRKALIEPWVEGNKMDPATLTLWVGHSKYDDYWKSRDLATRAGQATAAALHTAGWYDIFLQQSIDAFNFMQSHGGPGATGRQKIVIGPWTHGRPRKAGELTFPDSAPKGPLFQMPSWAWFDEHLKGVDGGLMAQPPVTYYVMGDVEAAGAPGNIWRTAEAWPPFKNEPTAYYLHGDHTLGARVSSPASPSAAGDSRAPGSLSYKYDPSNPVPTIGGPQLSIPSGAMDQRPIESRPDVLVFSTPPLDAPVEATGRVRARLWVSSDRPDTDFIVRLCDVYPDGRSFNVCEGALRMRFRESLESEKWMDPGRIYGVEVDLGSTSVIFNRGHRIRLHVTSSCAPGFDPNPNTATALRADPRAQSALNTLYLSADHPSQLLLPVPPTP